MNEKTVKVTDKDCREALGYLFEWGFIEEMTSNKRHYVTILAKRVAEQLNIEL